MPFSATVGQLVLAMNVTVEELKLWNADRFAEPLTEDTFLESGTVLRLRREARA